MSPWNHFTQHSVKATPCMILLLNQLDHYNILKYKLYRLHLCTSNVNIFCSLKSWSYYFHAKLTFCDCFIFNCIRLVELLGILFLCLALAVQSLHMLKISDTHIKSTWCNQQRNVWPRRRSKGNLAKNVLRLFSAYLMFTAVQRNESISSLILITV